MTRKQLVSFGTSGHRGSPLARLVHRGAHPGDHPGHLRLPAELKASTGPLYPGQGHPRAVRTGAAHGARGARGQRRRTRSSSATTAYTPTPVISRAILVHNRRRRADSSRTASSSRPRTILRKTAASSTTRPNGGPADTDVTDWIEDARQRTAARRQSRCQTPTHRRGAQCGNHASGRPRPALCRGPGECRRYRRDPCVGT